LSKRLISIWNGFNLINQVTTTNEILINSNYFGGYGRYKCGLIVKEFLDIDVFHA